MRSPTVPPEAEVVRTFAEYRKLVVAFFAGFFHLLIILGRPGLGKSHMFEERLDPNRAILLRGYHTPFKVYQELWMNRGKRVIMDDAELFWEKEPGLVLVRSLTEHTSRPLIQWGSASRQLEQLDIPTSFHTTSKCALICNKLTPSQLEKFAAIIDRGHLVYFDPPPIEIHKEAANWFWDQEIYDYIGDRLDLVKDLSARTYTKAWERKKAGGDWKKWIDTVCCHDATMRLVKDLEGRTCKKMEKVKLFVKETGMSRSTYYLYREQLEKDGQLTNPPKPPKIRLTGKPPEEVDIDEEIRLAQEEAAPGKPDDEASE
jgi:hypothetical protein